MRLSLFGAAAQETRGLRRQPRRLTRGSSLASTSYARFLLSGFWTDFLANERTSPQFVIYACSPFSWPFGNSRSELF